MGGYGEDLAAIHAAGFTGIATAAAAELATRLAPGSRVVELGCGDGTTARLLGGRRDWTEGDGWAVLIEAREDGDGLRRRIVSFRDPGDGRFRRAEELHRLELHAPGEVVARLRAAGFSARTLPGGYAGTPLPRGVIAYVAHKR